ncbi:MAG: hypothetical protein ACOX0J_12565 [Thermoactinomyces vulgaris]
MDDNRAFVEREWDKVFMFLSLMGGVLSFAIGTEIYTFPKNLRQKMEQAFAELKETAIKKFEKQRLEIETELNKKWNQFVQENKLNQRVDDLERLIQNERRYKEVKVMVLGSEEDLKNMKKYLDPAMTKRGVRKPEYISLGENPEQIPKGEIKNRLRDIDILVFYYNNENQSDDLRIREVTQLLTKEKSDIPIIVYTDDPKKKISNDDIKSLNKYGWFTPSNSSVTLLGHIFTYIHALPEKKEG